MPRIAYSTTSPQLIVKCNVDFYGYKNSKLPASEEPSVRLYDSKNILKSAIIENLRVYILAKPV